MKSTRGLNTLDVILTDLHSLYEEPIIVAPIEVDMPESGVPSDHSGVVATPRSVTSLPIKPKKYRKTIQPIPQSKVENIGKIFAMEKWDFLHPSLTSTQLTDLYQFYVNGIVDANCPKKTILVHPDDSPFITEPLKDLKRKIMREYQKRGKSDKYFELKETFKNKIVDEANECIRIE